MPISIERERIAMRHTLQHAPRAGVGPPYAFSHPSTPGAWQYKRRGIIGVPRLDKGCEPRAYLLRERGDIPFRNCAFSPPTLMGEQKP